MRDPRKVEKPVQLWQGAPILGRYARVITEKVDDQRVRFPSVPPNTLDILFQTLYAISLKQENSLCRM